MAEQTFKKETEWGVDKNDFIGESEITVTITLHEYRELIEKVAKADHEKSKVEEKVYEERKKAEAYKTKLDTLLEAMNGSKEEDEEDEF